MEYRYLGKSGLKVSNICLGTANFGMPQLGTVLKPLNQRNEEASHAILDKYEELGGNFIDTADAYQTGEAETIGGKWKERSRFIVSTKVFYPMDKTNVNTTGLTRRHIIEGCEASLERLQTPFIDLYQSHCWDAATPIEDSLRTMDDLVRAGKVHYFGVSNVCGWQMQQIVDTINMMGLNYRCISLQQQYNLIERHSELEEFMVCRNNGTYLKDRKPDITNGRIGLVHHDASRKTSAAPAWSQYANNDKYWAIRNKMDVIANTHGMTPAHVAIRWLLQKNLVAPVIIGATSTKYVEENCAASSGWELSSEEMSVLDEVSRNNDHYPYQYIYKNTTAVSRKNVFNQSYFP